MTKKKIRSFRVYERLLEKAYDMGLDTNEIVNAALAKAVKEKKCPFCNADLSKKGHH